VAALASLHVRARQRFCVERQEESVLLFHSRKPLKTSFLRPKNHLRLSEYPSNQSTPNQPHRATIQTLWSNRSSFSRCPTNTSRYKMVCATVSASREDRDLIKMLTYFRYEHSGHSTPKAREPAAREQGCPKGTRTKSIGAFMSK
jgi:hypothetical protein